MSHNVETIAFSGQTPWHNLGVKVSNNLSASEMQKAACLDWEVKKFDNYFRDDNDNEHAGKKQSLVRLKDMRVLSTVSEDWNPVQNSEAFEFFHKFVEAGQMTMETAGSLKKGEIVWAMAKVGKDFTLFNGDRVEAYLLFTNPHRYGKSIDIRFQPVRVVCNNTLTMALNAKVNNVFSQSHRVVFDPSTVEEALRIVDKRMDDYKDKAEFLGSVRYDADTIADYFDDVFPLTSVKGEGKRKAKERSTNASQALLALEHQPGLEYAPGTMWQAFNAVTYVTDHLMGRTDDARVENAWYGAVKDRKIAAFNKAIELAKAL